MPDGLTYAGLKACLDVEGQVGSMLRLLWPESRWPFRDRRWSEGFESSTLRTNRDPWLESPYPIDPCPRVNEIIIPTGAARYAKALLLLDHSTMLALAASVWNWNGNEQQTESPEALEALELEGIWGAEQNYRDLVATYGGKSLTWSMTALTPQLLTGGLWLLPLVDRRYFLHRNLRAIEFTDGEDMSWGSLCSELATISGMTIAQPAGFNAAYLVPDRETFASQGIGIGHIIDAATLSVGLRAVPVNKGTELQLVSASESRDLIEANYINQPSDDIPKHRQLGGFYPRAPKPRELKLVSPVLRNYYVCEGHNVTTSAIEESSVDNERIVIFTTCYAQYLESFFVGTSSSQLYALAERLRVDLSDWAKWSHGGTFAAVANYALTGHDDYWSIGFRAGRVINSQVRALPHDFQPRIQLSQAPAFFRHLDDTVLCRTTSEISARSGDQYGSGNATPVGLTSTGAEQVLTKSDGSAITIKIWNGGEDTIADELRLQCKRKDCLPVVDEDYATGGGGGGEGSALPIVAFTLTSDMAAGSAAATIDESYGAELTGTITVTDPQLLFVFAKSGAKGFAIKDGTTYIAIECDQLAIQLKAELANFPSSSPNFGLKPTTDGYIGAGYTALTTAPFGQRPLDLEASPIPNPLGLMGFPGDEAVLQFSKATGGYFFLAIERIATRVKGSVTADFNDSDTTVTIDGITGLNGKPPASDPLTVYNTHGWTGVDNAIIRAEFNPATQVYEMYQMDC